MKSFRSLSLVLSLSIGLWSWDKAWAVKTCTGAHLKESRKMTAEKFGSLFFRGMSRPNAKSVIVLLPGGPGLSGKYFDFTAKALAEKLNESQVGTLTLPNHDEAFDSRQDLNFEMVINQLSEAFQGLKAKYQNMVVVGHSYGSFLALVMASRGILGPDVPLILANTPSSFAAHPNFFSRLRELDAVAPDEFRSERDFRAWWAKALGAYVEGELSPEVKKTLTGKTYFMGAQGYSNGQLSWAQIDHQTLNQNNQISLIESKSDWRSPDKNAEELRRVFPASQLTLIDSGHFPMVEAGREFFKILIKLISDHPRS